MIPAPAPIRIPFAKESDPRVEIRRISDPGITACEAGKGVCEPNSRGRGPIVAGHTSDRRPQ